MSDLKEWIEAQLKRGYTKEHIKSFLIRKGYPRTAVAEVDKIAYSALSAKALPSKKIPKKFSSKTIALISIVVGIVLVVWLFRVELSPLRQESKDEFSILKIPSNDLCKDFSKIEGEVSCEEAIELALAEYPGEVYNIKKDKMITKTEVPGKAVYLDAWIVGINTYTSIKLPTIPGETTDSYTRKIEVGVDIHTKDVRLYKLLE